MALNSFILFFWEALLKIALTGHKKLYGMDKYVYN